CRPRRQRRWGEVAADAEDLLRGQRQRAILDARPFLLDLAADLVGARLVDEDLDARLELVVAPAEQVVDAQNRLDVRKEIVLRQEVADLVRDHRRAAETAADVDGEAEVARRVALQVQADAMDL